MSQTQAPTIPPALVHMGLSARAPLCGSALRFEQGSKQQPSVPAPAAQPSARSFGIDLVDLVSEDKSVSIKQETEVSTRAAHAKSRL